MTGFVPKLDPEDTLIFKTQDTVTSDDLRKVEKEGDKILVVHMVDLKVFGEDILKELGLWKSDFLCAPYKPDLTFEEFKKWFIGLRNRENWYAQGNRFLGKSKL